MRNYTALKGFVLSAFADYTLLLFRNSSSYTSQVNGKFTHNLHVTVLHCNFLR